MKIIVWATKSEAISGHISQWWNRNPQPTVVTGGDYVQVEITQDEFTKLEDK